MASAVNVESLFQRLATKDNREMAFRVKVDTRQWQDNTLSAITGITYDSMQFKTLAKLDDGFGSYVMTMARNADEPNFMWLYFGKSKTAAEMTQPFKTEASIVKDYEWPPILTRLVPVPDPLPQSRQTIIGGKEGLSQRTVYTWLMHLIPPVRTGTLRIRMKFQSPIRPSIPRHKAPIPTNVYAELPGSGDINIPECLHDTIRITGLQSGVYSVVNGASSSTPGMVGDLVFPETNFRVWKPFVFADDAQQDEASGLWYRELDLYVPPKVPKAQIRRA